MFCIFIKSTENQKVFQKTAKSQRFLQIKNVFHNSSSFDPHPACESDVNKTNLQITCVLRYIKGMNRERIQINIQLTSANNTILAARKIVKLNSQIVNIHCIYTSCFFWLKDHEKLATTTFILFFISLFKSYLQTQNLDFVSLNTEKVRKHRK